MDKKVLENYKKAGEIAAKALDFGKKQIKVGASLLEVTEAIEKKIKSLGGGFAFPTQISLNDVAAHNCPLIDNKTVFKKGDLVKIDVGVHVKGYIGDTACTVDFGDNKELVKASRDALNNAIKIAKPGTTLAEIGKTIQETIAGFGFLPVKNLTGHTLSEFNLHEHPSIPNFDTGDKTELKKDQVIAIEPFATNGAGLIYESGNATVLQLMDVKPVRGQATRQILQEIAKTPTLPFTSRWLQRKFPPFKVSFALRELKQLGMLKEYPALPDKNHGLVSQAEHTVLVAEEPKVLTIQH